MKNNKIHKLLGVITAPGMEGRDEFRYDELPNKVGFSEFVIRECCDILEREQLLYQRKHQGYFTRLYQERRQAYEGERYKEPEPALQLKSRWETWAPRVAVIEGLVIVFIATPIGLWLQYNTRQLEKEKQELQAQVRELQSKLTVCETLIGVPKK